MQALEPLQEQIVNLCSEGDLEGLSKLLAENIHVDLNFISDQNNLSPLMATIAAGRHRLGNPKDNARMIETRIKMMRLLVSKGANPDFGFSPSYNRTIRKTPLFYAIRDPDLLEELLKLGASPNLNIEAGEHPLTYAALSILGDLQGSMIATQLLLKYGANYDTLIEDGNNTPLINALSHFRIQTGVAAIYLSIKELQELSDNTFDKIIQGIQKLYPRPNEFENRITALAFRAVDTGNTKLLTHILNDKRTNKFDINKILGKGETLLSRAKIFGHHEMVKILLDRGAIDYEAYRGEDKAISEKRDYMKRYQNVIEAGHLHGLPSELDIPGIGGQEQARVSTSGHRVERSLPFLANLLKGYVENTDLSTKVRGDFNAILKAYQREIDYLHDPNPKKIDEMLKAYRNGEPLAVACEFTGHCFMIGLYKGKLIISNRGPKASQFDFIHPNLAIYNLKENAPLSVQLIEMLKDSLHHTPNEIMAAIGTCVDLRSPIAELPASNQKMDNCTEANPKAIMQAFLYLFEEERNPNKTLLISGKSRDLKESADTPKKYSRREYKESTKGMRNFDILRRIDVIAKNPDTLAAETEFQILKDIVLKHYGKTKTNLFTVQPKRLQEIERLEIILTKLPKGLCDRLIQEIGESHGNREFFSLEVLKNAVVVQNMNLVNFLLDHKISYGPLLFEQFQNVTVQESNDVKEKLILPLLRILFKRGGTKETIAKEMAMAMISQEIRRFGYREEDEMSETLSEKIKQCIEFVSKFLKEMEEPQKPAPGK